MIMYLLLLLCGLVIFYEIHLDRYYKKDLNNEKLISFFANTRMQLIKMLHMKEITANSHYFHFMMRATSYSIRTIYFRKNKLSLEQLDNLEEMLVVLNSEHLKSEFNNLNSEQKELFAKTALKILELYFSTEFIRKLQWTLYILTISSKILKLLIKILVGLVRHLNTKEKENISYINDLEKSYCLSQYAFA